jgi:hypothetical protein
VLWACSVNLDFIFVLDTPKTHHTFIHIQAANPDLSSLAASATDYHVEVRHPASTARLRLPARFRSSRCISEKSPTGSRIPKEFGRPLIHSRGTRVFHYHEVSAILDKPGARLREEELWLI